MSHLRVRPLDPLPLAVAVGASSDSWSVKSKAALLLALVVKRQGQQLWQALQPQLLPLAQQGPVQAEMVGSHARSHVGAHANALLT